MIKKYFFLTSLISIVNSEIPCKFCGSIIGNPINVSFSKDDANFSIILFGESNICNNEKYKIDNNKVIFSNATNDCLYTYLKTHGACPCPPDIIYNNTGLIIDDTPIGNIILKLC